MSEQTLKFGDIGVNKKEFHASKQGIALNLVDIKKVIVSDKFKCSDDGSKCFIGYLHDDDVIKPLCNILPKLSGYTKHLITVEKTCLLKLKMRLCIENTLKS